MRSLTALVCLVLGANAITPRERAQEIVANMTTDEKVRLCSTPPILVAQTNPNAIQSSPRAILRPTYPTHLHTSSPSHTHTHPAVHVPCCSCALGRHYQIQMLHGAGGGYVGNVPAIERLSIPAITMNDGPQGFRDNAHVGTTTSFPSGLTIGATFDVAAASLWGTTMGQEFFDKGANVQLGPGMCLARIPRNGRNFEYIAGEDPYLGYIMVNPVIKGIQSKKVVANAKHWVMNNQETNRQSVSENVDERTRFEMYYEPFRGAVEADVGSIMCSYNKINHKWSCENPETLAVDLKQRLGFDGWVMSDWGATHSMSINEGLDQEMPGASYMGDKLKAAYAAKSVSEDRLRDAVVRVLTPLITVGAFDHPSNGTLSNNVTNDAHRAVCKELATKATVLVKNAGNVLPFKKSGIKIAVAGPGAKNPTVHGGGSGQVVPSSTKDPYTSLRNALGLPPAKPRPFKCDASTYEDNTDYFQPNNPFNPATDADDCCKQCGARQDCNYFSFQKQTKQCYFKSTNNGRKTNNQVISGGCHAAPTNPTDCKGDTCLYYIDDASNVTAAAKADVAVVFVQTTSSEGGDRGSLSLSDDQNQLVEAVAKANKNTVVVAVTPGALLMPWADKVAAVLVPFMPGQE